MLPCNMIRSRQPRPAISPTKRTLPLSSFSHTDPPILCPSPLPSSPNSTHPTQLDTPAPPQPLCYQSNPRTFRHTWGWASVFTFNFEFFAPHGPFRTCPHQCPHQRHSASLIRPLFSYSYALFCTAQNAISHLFIPLRTLCTKHPGGVRQEQLVIAGETRDLLFSLATGLSHRLGRLEDVAAVAALLAAGESSYFTGTTFVVGGGLIWNYE